MAPWHIYTGTREYLMLRDPKDKLEILIPGSEGRVDYHLDRQNLSQSREANANEIEKFHEEHLRSLLKHAFSMYGYLNDTSKADKEGDLIIDNLHIHPSDSRPSSADILGASISPKDLSIVLTQNHIYLTWFPDKPHQEQTLQRGLRINELDYLGPNYQYYAPEYSIFKHASSPLQKEPKKVDKFIDALIVSLENSNLGMQEKKNLQMIFQEIRENSTAAQIFKNAYLESEAKTLETRTTDALKQLIEIMNAFFLDKQPQSNELAFYLNHGSIKSEKPINRALFLEELSNQFTHNPALQESDFAKYLEKCLGIRIIKMPLDKVIRENLIIKFENKKQDYIQSLFDNETRIDLIDNPHQQYYLDRYQIKGFQEGLEFIRKINLDNPFRTKTRDLLRDFLKDYVNSPKKMRSFLDELTKTEKIEPLLNVITDIYHQIPEKGDFLKQTLLNSELELIGKSFPSGDLDFFHEFIKDFKDTIKIYPERIKACAAVFAGNPDLCKRTAEFLIITKSRDAAIEFLELQDRWELLDSNKNQSLINKLKSTFNL